MIAKQRSRNRCVGHAIIVRLEGRCNSSALPVAALINMKQQKDAASNCHEEQKPNCIMDGRRDVGASSTLSRLFVILTLEFSPPESDTGCAMVSYCAIQPSFLRKRSITGLRYFVQAR